jgi:hypothetical protein
MRKALVVGIDAYRHLSPLFGCERDARAMSELLGRNEDGSVNFGSNVLLGTEDTEVVTRARLRDSIEQLFSGDGEVALLHFSGHGHVEAAGGYLCAGDTRSGSDGVPLAEVMTFANASRFRNRIIFLDSCHSGIAGGQPLQQGVAEIAQGVTVLTASTAEQYALEQNGSGLFTGLVLDALRGAAANLVGDVTPGSVYAHVDESLGPWAQRPLFKTNVTSFISLRKVRPPIELSELRRIKELFPVAGYSFRLDPAYEAERIGTEGPDVSPPDPEKTEVFSILQKLNRLNLLVPEDAPHMWHAAIQSKSCRLTPLGEHYRRLVEDDRI